MKQSHKELTNNANIIGEIVQGEDNQYYLEVENKSGGKFIWKPQGLFNAMLKEKKDCNEKIYVSIHVHVLKEGEVCEK